MAGSLVSLTHNEKALQANLKAIARRCGSMRPAMAIIGETVRSSVVRNFEKGGRPEGWQPLSPVTEAMKKGGSILVGKGHGGGLLGSINARPGENAVLVGTNKVYAAIHQFGGQAGRGHKVAIPARPYLLVQEEDWPEIREQLSDFILQGEK